MLTSERRPALILYLTAGHPDAERSRRAAVCMAELADVLEIGIPFSDPVADGPAIQESTQVALANGTGLADCFALARHVRARARIPVVFLTYYNPVLHHGLDRFAHGAAESGADAVICPDLPSEEAQPLRRALTAHDLDLVPMVSPTSTDSRLELAGSAGSGFIYCVSRTGVTGEQDSPGAGLQEFLARVRSFTDLPRGVGFGVGTPRQAREIASVAEGVIIGSAVIRLLREAPSDEFEERIRAFVAAIRSGMNGGE